MGCMSMQGWCQPLSRVMNGAGLQHQRLCLLLTRNHCTSSELGTLTGSSAGAQPCGSNQRRARL